MFRLIVIKYADRGLAQTGGLSSSRFNTLYILPTASFSLIVFLIYLIKFWIQINGGSNEGPFLLLRPICSTCCSERYPAKALFFISLWTILILMSFCSVQYLKKYKTCLKKEIQRNIVTFHNDFYFFLSFSILSSMTIIVKIIALKHPSFHWIESLHLFVNFISVFIVGFVRPVIILYLLRQGQKIIEIQMLCIKDLKILWIRCQTLIFNQLHI